MKTREEIAAVVAGLARTRYRIAEPHQEPNNVPHEMDCQDLLVYIQRECFGRDVLGFVIPGASIRDLIRFARDYPGRLNWRVTDTPEHGGAVEMSMENSPHHVGVWLDIDGGGILHAYKGGVSFQREIELKVAGWRRFVYHAWIGHPVSAS